jgi:SAM-dependent methyltransferase
MYHMHERERNILLGLAKANIDLNHMRVLEIGCGTGHILQRFLEFGIKQGVGVDLMQHRLKSAAMKYPNIGFLLGDGAEIPCRDEMFDLVMQFMCLSSILDDDVRCEIAKEMWRVLKPGGIILSYDLRTVPKVAAFSARALHYLSAPWRKRSSMGITGARGTPTRPLDAEELRNLFNGIVLELNAVSLQLDLAGIVKKSFLLTTLLSMIPYLRTHYLAIIKKPRYSA